MPEMGRLTGDDLAEMIRFAAQHQCLWVIVPGADGMLVPYTVDRAARVVYGDGGLPINRCLTAICDGLTELAAADARDGVVPLAPPDERTG